MKHSKGLTGSELRALYERTACDCHKCVSACKTMPGSLAPGDMHQIATFLGEEITDEFVGDHFEASEGALALRDGEVIRIPTIVPKQKGDGRCVFLTDDDRCSIHSVSPFGCSRFKVCGDDEEQGVLQKTSVAMLECVMRSIEYIMMWSHLWERGKRAAPLRVRRGALHSRLVHDTDHPSPPEGTCD